MPNLAMKRKLESGECRDVSRCARTPDGDYVLEHFEEEVDYANAETEEWIWSIGRDRATGQILASHSTRFYQNPAYECVWLR